VSGKVLISIVDDDESLRSALVGLVRSLGYEARGFESAEHFLRDDGMQDASCIITDIQMPGMSGIDLKRHLTATGCAVPTIMITARPEKELETSAHASGAICLLRKPFEADVLIECVEKALELGSKSARDGGAAGPKD
jgi:FixJ family two-component response regulator